MKQFKIMNKYRSAGSAKFANLKETIFNFDFLSLDFGA